LKKTARVLLTLLAVLLLLAGGYVGYVLLRYHRLGYQSLTVQGPALSTLPETGREYTLVSYNIGFGAYEADFGFFMDGGEESWAWSRERLDANLGKIGDLLHRQDDDFCLIQEVDIDATRSYRRDERTDMISAMPGKDYVFAQNYDSPFLLYPFRQPHGASKSGIMTFSSFPIGSSERLELPVETGFMKFLDLDRCYAKSRIPLGEGRDMVLYAFHLSAYTSDGTIATEQLKQLMTDMAQTYAAGNYAIAGGDFNKDLLGNSSEVFGVSGKDATWAQAFPFELLPKNVALQAPFDAASPVPSCRNCDIGYEPGVTFVLTIDGFLTTANVQVEGTRVIDDGFLHSDHNPVVMTFILKDG
jgi:hypothetical protein